jgi:primosomal protein N'
MTEEYKKNIKQCPNCSTHWTFNNDDVQEKTVCGGFYGDYKEYFIKCPKCNNHLELYNDNGIYR